MASGHIREQARPPEPSLPSLVVTPAETQGVQKLRDEGRMLDEPPMSPRTNKISPLVSDLERWAPAPDFFPRDNYRERRLSTRTESSGAPQERSKTPLPSLPKSIGPQEDAQARMAALEVDVFKASNWRRWMGINQSVNPKTSFFKRQKPTSHETPASNGIGVPSRTALDVDVDASPALETIGVINPESDPSLTPTISRVQTNSPCVTGINTPGPYRKDTATSVPAFLSGTASMGVDPKEVEFSPLQLPSAPPSGLCDEKDGGNKDLFSKDAPAEDAPPVTSATSRAIFHPTPQTQVVRPQPRIPSVLLDRRWSLRGSSSSSVDEEQLDDLSMNEPIVDDPVQRLNLSHCDLLTNKDLRALRRQMRKIPAELRDETRQVLSERAGKDRLSPPNEAPRSRSSTPIRTPSPFSESSLQKIRSMLHSSQPMESLEMDDLQEIRTRESVSQSPLAATDRPHVWRRRQRRAWNKALAEDDVDDDDPQFERTTGPRVYTTPVNPDQPEYAYDMLHENQRGIVLFGVSKRFSSNVLSLFDPSPWTNAEGVDTALDISKMQLPDPTWEWVHPTWMVDMTGDTDEDGWQYSGSFTGLQFWRRPIAVSSKKGPRRWWQALHMFAHSVDLNRAARRESKEASRPDEGLEALMRTVRMRSEKWTGKPGIWTFVRRRRWVRLRRRVVNVHLSKGASVMTADGTPVMLSNDKDRVNVDETVKREKDELKSEVAQKEVQEECASSMCETQQVLTALERLRRLLPFFLIPPPQLAELLPPGGQPIHKLDAWHRHFRLILEQETYIQNPFFALGWIQRWLARPDLREYTRELRMQEKEYQKAYVEKDQMAKSKASSIPFTQESRNYPHCAPYGSSVLNESLLLYSNECNGLRPSIVRQAVIEHNFGMVVVLMRLCMADRLRVNLWLEWLQFEPHSEAFIDDKPGSTFALLQQESQRRRAMLHHVERLGSTPAMFSPLTEHIMRTRIHDYTHSRPRLLDVWDILIAHVRKKRRKKLTFQLNDVLGMLDHEASRQRFMEAVLHLSSKQFYVNAPEESQSACPEPSDPRWKQVAPGVMMLPSIPAVSAGDAHTESLRMVRA